MTWPLESVLSVAGTRLFSRLAVAPSISINPTGTILDDDRLLELRETETTAASELALEVPPVADAMDPESGEHVGWGIDE